VSLERVWKAELNKVRKKSIQNSGVEFQTCEYWKREGGLSSFERDPRAKSNDTKIESI